MFRPIDDPRSIIHNPPASQNSLFSLLRVQDSSHAEVDGSEKTLPHALLGGVRRQLDGEETCVAYLNTGGRSQAKNKETNDTSTADRVVNPRHARLTGRPSLQHRALRTKALMMKLTT